MTVLPAKEVKFFANSPQKVLTCPFCLEAKRLDDPKCPQQVWEHECKAEGGAKVWFVNDHAISGVGKYMRDQRPANGGTSPC